MRSRPSIVQLDQLAQAARLSADLAVDERATLSSVSQPLLPGTTTGMYPPPPDDTVWY
jgi:hypothetical protein